jgi:DNA-binding NarL/FixJ family response regulator
MCPLRTLVVDDFEPWRKHIRSTLDAQPEIRVADEACNGLEAIQKAEELQPDLILLDIGLPDLNGLEAAKQLGRRAPAARILFLSQDDDSEVVRAALSNGARGFVLKMDAESELLPAIQAVLRGEKFVSSGIKRRPV